ncbi:Glyoxalase/Bleomycin resistance protein/Dioxygenase superfamily protein [Pigmentiphaga humi]|uniref:Glyoxalase/Bleomycin resistance protein/Dioxygenase superfamily protein n=1 Tax=Pigmentiphaga humi TaxID=2478468 RepID=A0A3P4B5W1_9BURK|nr:VOC family protein [Pigmentiphaga humi]VCU71689.1 Glyoxalase/Bleomycin resistance protein/Dioxygenase superfamily protein [Pigmentiphaga humi]
MLKVQRPTPSHFGIFVTDLEKMVAFYTETFDLTITDRGVGRTFKNQLVFTSASPDQHHQLVLASGRPPEATFSTVMQISFAVPSIQHLRDVAHRAQARGATELKGLNHGNALSVYMRDPEGNTVEIYVDTPFYVAQPHGDPLDLSQDDETIMRETEAICRRDPTFMPLAEWQARFLARSEFATPADPSDPH